MTTSINMNAVNTLHEEPVTLAGSAHFDADTGEMGYRLTMGLIRRAAGVTAELVDGMTAEADAALSTYDINLEDGARVYTELGNLALDNKTRPEDVNKKQAEGEAALHRLRSGQMDGLQGFRRANQAIAALAVAADEGFSTSQTARKVALLDNAAEAFIKPRTDGVRNFKEANSIRQRGFPKIDIDTLRANAKRATDF